MTRFILAFLLVYCASPTHAGDLQRDFGAACDGVADDTAAVEAWLDSGAAARLTAGVGRCRVTAQIAPRAHALNIQGTGIDRTVLLRDYDGTAGLGLITLREGSRGSIIRDLSIISAPGRSGGHALAIISTAEYTAGNTTISNVKFSCDGSDCWQTTVRLDGTARLAEPRGVRAVTFSDTHIFGASFVSLELATVVGFSFRGGGLYPASGTTRHSGGVQIRGTTTHPSQYILISASTMGVLNLSNVLDAQITSATLGIGNGAVIETAGSAVNVAVWGQPYPGPGVPNFGVLSNWSNSRLFLPNGRVIQ